MVLRVLLWVGQCLRAVAPRLATQRLLFGAVVGAALLASLHVCFYVTSGKWRPAPQWLREDQGRACLPRSNIGFLKNHKCASSAIQNILFRYGLSHRLHFALPEVSNYFGGGVRPFHSGMLMASPWSKLATNIMAIHTKWDHSQVQLVMPNDTIYITIVREPTQLFESLYVYTKMNKTYKMSVEEFAMSVPTGSARYHGYLGYNQMVWDFGMPDTHMNNLTAVEELVKRADEEFDLVLVAERMEESLVLMTHLLCWDLKDVLVLKVNARNDKFKKSLGREAKEALRQKLAPDYLLYEHFVRKFDEHVDQFGRDRMAREVTRLRQLTEQLIKTCGFVKKEATRMTGPEKPSSNLVDGYKAEAGNSRCAHYSRSEHSFINLLRAQQRIEVSRRFGLRLKPGLDALPLGPDLLQNPSDMADNINTLKKMLVHTDNQTE